MPLNASEEADVRKRIIYDRAIKALTDAQHAKNAAEASAGATYRQALSAASATHDPTIATAQAAVDAAKVALGL